MQNKNNFPRNNTNEMSYIGSNILKQFHAFSLSPTFERRDALELCFTSTSCFIKYIAQEHPVNLGNISDLKLVDLGKILGKFHYNEFCSWLRVINVDVGNIIQINTLHEIHCFELESEECKRQLCSWWNKLSMFLKLDDIKEPCSINMEITDPVLMYLLIIWWIIFVDVW